MTVHRLVHGDVHTAGEVVVLVACTRRGDPFEKTLKVAKQQRLVFVDSEAERCVERLEMQAAHPHARPAHLVAKTIGDVDEFSGARGLEAKPLADHQLASKARSRSSRVGGAGTELPEAAAADSASMARANAIWTLCGAAPASSREDRVRHRSPMRRPGAAAARAPRPWSRSPISISAAASASRGCASGSYVLTASWYERYASERPSSHKLSRRSRSRSRSWTDIRPARPASRQTAGRRTAPSGTNRRPASPRSTRRNPARC